METCATTRQPDRRGPNDGRRGLLVLSRRMDGGRKADERTRTGVRPGSLGAGPGRRLCRGTVERLQILLRFTASVCSTNHWRGPQGARGIDLEEPAAAGIGEG